MTATSASPYARPGSNFADTMARAGLYPPAPKPPCVLGYEVSGVVEAVGPAVTGVQVGQRVMAGTRFGGQAEMVAVPEDNVLPLPDRLSFEQGAAVVVNYATAYGALHVFGGLRAGDRVLIHAAAGGVGMAATQLARNAGAEIFGTASASKHEAIREPWRPAPDRLPQHRLRGEVRRILGGQSVPRPGARRARPEHVPEGLRPAPAGRTAGHVRAVEAFDERGSQLARAVTEPGADADGDHAVVERGPNAQHQPRCGEHEPAQLVGREGNLDRLIRPVLADLAAGRVEPVVSEVFPFSRAADAHRALAERRNIGKVVLAPDGA